ncbi:IclR family transcriptional regulator [Listeria cossartiae subsp. cayugensis]|uniref:IclR family transcriptional regulator n=1 Tax=Listeria cossartiae TaxID=2838249 RepID=UPI0028808AFC|nr:IclR family transcriptional regulator [Listeria cossartiae]MDT0004166.1 IclR family transcriptional regulator [Listeria cossartiae subsp. cayugensis]MDT0020560.1 IclR family transcriptional regulator [Listeria cossartiae subsp. cayugensis]MDT0036225.1 IclR family transcriptional regulator [Listeria cossartiae subsp. cayugensis]MDT0042311.1 IclR family transcriptional regulator [Listeria cossartiae subsp. cayugensis]MDT0047662.1 IclR family transcriptional regulator [Listeria cossartiae subs
MKHTHDSIRAIAIEYAEKNKTEYYSLEFISAKPSTFTTGYWDVGFSIKDSEGNELDGLQLLALNDNTGEVKAIEELINEKSCN